MSDDAYSPLGEGLKSKKLQKVTVMSDSKEGLKKGLTKAEELMKLKGMEPKEEESDEMDDSPEHEMSEEMEDESESEESEDKEMSKEEMLAMIEMLKKKLENA